MKKVLIIVFTILISFSSVLFVNAQENYTLRVLVIEINPILKTVQNNSYYHNNDGHPFVSEYFGHDKEKALYEVKEDLEEISHGYLSIEFVKREYLDEFPTYTSTVTLNNGQVSNRYDEETFISLAKSSKNRDVGNWGNFIYYPYNKPADYTFDYEYIINKFDLVNRKNNDEFDQVWMLVVDPGATYETMMVGRNAFWINGTPLIQDCDNFMISTISISRRDANLHAYAHSSEFIMNYVFKDEFLDYTVRYNDINDTEFNKLDLWSRFSMTSYQSSGGNSGVGNVHFPFNGAADYDYTNKNSVNTNWKDWLNYPNLGNNKELNNDQAWVTFEPNLLLGEDEEKDPDRLYIRFWYYLMPHIEGRTEDGYYNNWWKYITTFDYVTEIKMNDFIDKEYEVGDVVSVDLALNYKSGNVINYKLIEDEGNVQILGDTIKFENGILKVTKEGKSILSLCFDGKCVSYNIYSSIIKSDNTTILFIIIISIIVVSLMIATIVLGKKRVHKI